MLFLNLSLSELHFPFPPIIFSIFTHHYTNPSYHFRPFIQTNVSPSTTRLRPSLPIPDQTHFTDFDTASLFYSTALNISARREFLPQLKQVHAHLFKFGLCHVLSLQNQILHAYFKCNQSLDAHKVFEELRVRNVVSWNIVIRGNFDSADNSGSNPRLGLSYFRRMMMESALPDFITFNSLIGICVQLNDIHMGTQLHCFTVKLGFDLDCFVGSSLVDLYAKCGLTEDARLVFSCVRFKDLVMWNVMISCYALNCLPEEACGIFNLMRLQGVKGDEFTYSSLGSSCGTSEYYEFGKQIHSLILKQSFDSDVSVASALINIYAKNDNITDARSVFDAMENRNVVSWNTLIVGCGKYGHGNEVMKLLRSMLREEVVYPDDMTLSSTFSSCGYASAIIETKQAHAFTIKFGFQESITIANSLLTAYSKCGSITCAYKCFSSIMKPDLVSWTSMINAYAFHGRAKEANGMFEKMVCCGIKPDKVSFLGVLSACAHSGLVTKGLHYFKLMTNVYHIVPETEHYACLVDLLGRCGLIQEAFELLRSMPTEPESNTLGAFVGSCKIHENAELARWAAEKLMVMEPKKSVNYTVMSNIYASDRRWCDVERLRKNMEDKCNLKVPGCSWIEIGDQVHSFVSGDRSHPQASEVYATLKMLLMPMKEDNI
ncbi:pentatricopeptide repeat-containing protein [Senna tora]|uniref:Pentatricopeptide repeat-containing protein n=1 Tax=Senna tora TaxID=362788 RepID=A0A834TRI1_9FABA|nr:pentatricopeptide repeat-containing protein [Senna tora]